MRLTQWLRKIISLCKIADSIMVVDKKVTLQLDMLLSGTPPVTARID